MRPLNRRHFVKLIGASSSLACLAPGAVRANACRLPSRASWAVFYGASAELSAFAGLDVVVLDPQFQGSVPALTKAGVTTLGYLSLGEFAKTSGYFDMLASKDALLYESKSWPGTFIADVRHPAWKRLVLDVVIKSIKEKGFKGLFFDTLDTPPYLESLDPLKYAGMRSAAVDLVKAIRAANPDMPMMMNRGYALIPDLRDTVDAIMAESSLSTYDAATKTYRRLTDELVQQQLDLLQHAKTTKGSLPIYSLNYWDPADKDGVRKLYADSRALGHTPYVATILLDRIYTEPKI